MRRLLLLALLAAGCAAPAERTPAPSEPDERLQVAFVIVDGVYNTELTAPFDIFHHTVFHAEPGMRVFTVAHDREPVTTFEGIRILPDATFAACPPVDVLVVPSTEHSMDTDLEDAELIAFVRERGRAADHVLAYCDGTFVLAEAGLLDGPECTTFPGDIERLRAMFPTLTVHGGLSFVHDGQALTSAGGARSFESALYLCEHLYGRAVAEGIARGMVIDWKLAEVPHRVVE